VKCCNGSILYGGGSALRGLFICIMDILACGIASAVLCFVW